MNPAPVHLFHIAYSQPTLATMRPGFKLLDNLANPRPDWYESWPIRKFLSENKLDEKAYYGFFSPKFHLKTGLEANDIRKFIANSDETVDAYFVCPQPEVGAVFLNPVWGSEFTDPGALETVQKVLDIAQIGVDIGSTVIDSTQLVYSNYVVAKPVFWRKWLKLVNRIYELAESGSDTQLQAELVKPTAYGADAQRKVFLAECLASILFITEQMKVKSIPLDSTKAARGIMYPYFEQAMACDALKIAFNKTGDLNFLQEFQKQSAAILSNFKKPAVSDPASQKTISKETTVKQIVVAVATRLSEENFYQQSATGKSLQLMKFSDVTIRLFANNAQGLSKIYNQVIEEYLDQNVILVFVHDDLHFLDLFWPHHLRQGLTQFELVGIVGNKSRHHMQPSWAFLDITGTWDAKDNLSGSVAHGTEFPPETCAEFGPTGSVKLLDGLFLAASAETFKNAGLRFDERFNFHFYDMDLCRSAELLHLRTGTIPLSLMHESKGSFNNQSWLDAYKAYIQKWQG
jgi:GT2 family glycosyltransferase